MVAVMDAHGGSVRSSLLRSTGTKHIKEAKNAMAVGKRRACGLVSMGENATHTSEVSMIQQPRQKKRKRSYGLGFGVSHNALGLFGGKPPLKKPKHAKSSIHRDPFPISGQKENEEAEIETNVDVRRRGHFSYAHRAPSLPPKRNTTQSKIEDGLGASLSPLTRVQAAESASRVPSKPKSFLDKMRLRLSGGQFRMLNEKLYTCSGEEAFTVFKDDPIAFQFYHAGYQEQMNRWPRQPVEAIIDWLRVRSASLLVADFGCGDGRLARSIKNKVFSLDLVASDPSIMACNMAHTPLSTSSVDVAVFCLSLMGTDYPSFLVEAHRVLKMRGWLLVAEVRSRFDPENGGADPEQFINALDTLGFTLVSKDFSNKMFIMFQFTKEGRKGSKSSHGKWPKLKPCMYKRR